MRGLENRGGLCVGTEPTMDRIGVALSDEVAAPTAEMARNDRLCMLISPFSIPVYQIVYTGQAENLICGARPVIRRA